jgi:hypothetical protein
MDLMSFDVHGVYELPYQDAISAFKERTARTA